MFYNFENNNRNLFLKNEKKNCLPNPNTSLNNNNL